LFAALSWTWRQDWFFGDGYAMVRLVARSVDGGGLPVWRHVLFLPLARLFAGAPFDLAPADACRLVSALSGGVLVGATGALARRRFGTAAAVAAALLVATSPAVSFFASTVEVHALHGAVAALGALAILSTAGVKRRVASALSIAACFLAHESSWLLVPGWILLAAGFLDPAPSAGARPLLRGSIDVLAGVAVGILAASGLKLVGEGAGSLSSLGLVRQLDRGGDLRLLWSGAVRPFGALFFVAALAVLGRGRRLALLVAALVLPHAAFVAVVFSDPNQGGYLLPVAWALGLAAAGAFATRPRLLWLAIPLLALHVVESHALLTSPGQDAARDWRAERAATAREALPAGGLVLSVDYSLQSIEGEAPGVRELNLWRDVSSAVAAGESPDSFAARTEALFPRLRAQHAAIAFDLTFERQLAQHPEAIELVRALVERLRDRGPTHVVEVGGARMLVFDD